MHLQGSGRGGEAKGRTGGGGEVGGCLGWPSTAPGRTAPPWTQALYSRGTGRFLYAPSVQLFICVCVVMLRSFHCVCVCVCVCV